MSTKFGNGINMLQTAILNALLHPLSGAPSSPQFGQVYADSTLNAVGFYLGSWVYISASDGTVSTVSVANANGFAGTVANATTTPAITLQTTISGLLKGNGTAISAAVANTDYAPVSSPAFTGTPTAPTPTGTPGSTQIATVGYVAAVAQGLNVKNSAVAASVGTETFTITSGSVTQISGTTLDGVSPNVNDYVLIKDAPAATGTGSAGSLEPANGLYQVTGNTTNLSVSRAADMSGTNTPVGAFVFVAGGTANGDSGWVVSTPSTSGTFTYGTNNIQWQQFSGAGEITAGTGLSKTGNTLSIGSTVPQKYTTGTIGNGSATTLTVTHNLNNNYPQVTVWDLSGSNPQVMYCDVVATSTNALNLVFGAAPASNSVRCTVIG